MTLAVLALSFATVALAVLLQQERARYDRLVTRMLDEKLKAQGIVPVTTQPVTAGQMVAAKQAHVIDKSRIAAENLVTCSCGEKYTSLDPAEMQTWIVQHVRAQAVPRRPSLRENLGKLESIPEAKANAQA